MPQIYDMGPNLSSHHSDVEIVTILPSTQCHSELKAFRIYSESTIHEIPKSTIFGKSNTVSSIL